jgi:Rrf2 family transcriptional regulator, iron-sulfur cluster assembly transcription factor
MLFSKTFSYAVRGILYIALMQDEKQRVQLDEITDKVGVPRHFIGKVLKRLVKENLLGSTKGPHGGFYLHTHTLATPLLEVIAITDGLDGFNKCVLRFHKCNLNNPCPMHAKVSAMIQDLHSMVGKTTIGDLLGEDKMSLIASIATLNPEMQLTENSLHKRATKFTTVQNKIL